ncbi:hypothetical protein A4S05_32865 [Nostoc sp. KVJ20]|uniref:RNA-directed DNA polymerase n=1 Tax=Nostoc sp. KVJ20 TaxID=457944 RepID=UPI00083CC54E|nr:RNA-directed DNA polymerase [Nostoc sp. KVJ20]ODH00533.1 hypothetical protein A4S05_32865 [Nostoc sp. KVJ20]
MIQTNSPLIQTEDFIRSGFFPKELVPAFTTEGLANNLDKINSIVQETPKKSSSKCSYYSFPKSKYSRRNLAIPNPLHQIILCNTLSDNWQQVRESIETSFLYKPLLFCCEKRNEYSLDTEPFPGIESSLSSDSTIERAVSANYKDLLDWRVIRSVGYSYCLHTDISRFYSTIYTHSIPWAIHGKDISKINRNESLIGNKIDRCVRNTQDQQTLGIPIGTDSSLIIAEIIGSAVDKRLKQVIPFIFDGFRYMDDYYLYFNSLSDAEFALSQIHKILQEFELENNSEKTFIVELPESIEPIWVSEMRRYPISDKNIVEQHSDIITYFSKVFEYSKLFPEDFVIKYGLRKVSKICIKHDNWNLYESFILQSIMVAPNALVIATEILLSYSILGYELNKEKISCTINSLICKHSNLNHSHEVSWALWLSKTLNIPIEGKTIQAISDLEDSVVAIVALDLYQNYDVIKDRLEFKKWESIVKHDLTDKNLYSKNWLLCYEANIKGYFPQIDQNNYIAEDPFFCALKDNNVTFYDNTKQVQNLIQYIIKPYDFDDEVNHITDDSSWMLY